MGVLPISDRSGMPTVISSSLRMFTFHAPYFDVCISKHTVHMTNIATRDIDVKVTRRNE